MTPRTKVAITGATGFLGGRAARYLRDAGFDVIGLGRDPFRGAALEAAGIRFHPVDLSDAASLQALFAGVDVVVHCAALSTAWATAAEYESVNVHGTQNVVAACEHANVRRLIHISTPAVLSALTNQYALDEHTDIPSEFTSMYGASKAAAERAVSASVVESAILRPKAIYGPGDTALLPRLLDAARRHRLRIIGDGSTLTHLTHVDDAAQAIHQAIMAPEVSGVYHIAGPVPVRLWDMLSDLLPRLGYQPPTKTVATKRAIRIAKIVESIWRTLRIRGEPPITVYKVAVVAFSQTLDTTRAREHLAFEPTVTAHDGMASVLASLEPDTPRETEQISGKPQGDAATNATFLTLGTVRPSGWLVGHQSRARIELPLISVALTSPRHGVTLFDAGYGPRLPAREWTLSSLYNWIIQPQNTSTTDALRRAGVDPHDVETIVLSHLHPDHFGGIAEFPNAEIVLDAGAWTSLPTRSHRLLRATISMRPYDISRRIRMIDTARKPYDLFGDGSVILRHLAGHTHGHIGADITTTDGRYMLCGDAVWTREQLRTRRLGAGSWIAEDRRAAAATMKYLVSLEDVTIVPAHCPEAADELLGNTWRSRDGHSTGRVVAQR